MILKIFTTSAVLLLTACSTRNYNESDASVTKVSTPAQNYTSSRNVLVPVNTIASSNNKCVDNFNFLRQAKSEDYQNYSRDYIKIGDGFAFLNKNKNIMGTDARQVYTINLDMKLDALCNKVDYAGYQIIKKKMAEISQI